MLALIAASLFASHQRVPVPGAIRVAIVGRQVVAFSDGRATFLKADGAGKFVAAQTIAAGTEPFGSAVADLDGDGKPDLAVANHTARLLTLLFGDGRSRTVAANVEPHAHSVAAADFDGDGHLDLALNDMAGRRALILWGPLFETATAAPTGSSGYAYLNVAAADFDGDGAPDLALPNWPRGEVAVLLADGKGKRGFHAAPGSPLQLANPAFFVAAADFDGDGKRDLAVATFSGAIVDPSRDGVALFRGDGRGGFAKPVLLESGPGPTSLAAADIDGDGIADLAVCNQGGTQVTVFLGGKSGLRAADPVRVQGAPTGIALGDLDGDGKADLAVVTSDAVEIFLTK